MKKLTPESLRAALPDTSSTLALSGLEGPVVIYRDRHGIPHVRAESEHDAFFGQGFAHAQDRLWQMETDRRRAFGAWSELVGAAGLEEDRQMRRFQIGRTLEQDYAAAAPATRTMLDAYASGVNAFLASAAKLPAEFELVGAKMEPWRPTDCMAVFKVRHIMMGVWEGKIWRAKLLNRLGPEKTARFIPGYAEGGLVMVPPGARFGGPALDGVETLTAGLAHLDFMREGVDAGSNNWVAGGSRTASGLPLMAGDPHRALDVPNVYYQNHVACPAFDVVGFSFAGLPGFPHFAHNAHVAWCITHGQADYQDIFIEEFDPENPTRYRFREEWREAELHAERIEVRDGAAVEMEVWRTHHGPIIAGEPRGGRALAFCYTATAAPNRTMDAVHQMLMARNADELEESQRPWVDPVNNMLYCDVHGAFGYRTRGELPLRDEANGWLPVPGWSGAHEWEGRVPFEEMPAVRNPAAGYAYSANNRIAGAEYPHYIALDYTSGFRAERINALLEQASGLDEEGMRRIHGDIVSVPALAFRELYGKIAPPDDPSARALELLRAWDGRADGASPAPLIFAAFRHRLLHNLLEPTLGPLADEAFVDRGRGAAGFLRRIRSGLHEAIASDDATWLPPGTSWSGLMALALREAAEELTRRLGPSMESWRWDDPHRTAAGHPLSPHFPEAAPLLDPPAFPMAGDGDTVMAGGFDAEQGYQVELLSVARYLFDPADWSRSAWVIPGGVSGHPGSPHFADQIETYRRIELLPMLYDWDRIAAAAETTQRLEPGAG